MTLETLISVLAVLAALAAFVERGVELVKPILEKLIKDGAWLISAKVLLASLVGFGLAALLRIDPLAMIGVSVSPVIGYAAAGVLASAGASPFHAILEWLKTIKR